MTAFTLTQNRNIDELTGKTGGDTYTTNGFKLTIDQDSRYGLNQTTSTTLGGITLSATTGGEVHIDGTGIWIIPFTGGTGNVPAYNTVITNGSGSGKLIGVHSTTATAPTTPGSAMPASGFVRVKQKTGTYQAGALTGVSAIASDAGRVGWIHIVGDDTATVTANRLGIFRMTGAWYEIGTTTGTSGLVGAIPSGGLDIFVGGVFVETGTGTGVFEFYSNVGTSNTVVTTGTELPRSKVCLIVPNGSVYLGNNGNYNPPAGRRVVIGNVLTSGCTTALRTANTLNSSLPTRYDFTTTGGGVLIFDKCVCSWYMSATQAYSVQANNTVFLDAINVSELASPLDWYNVGVGPNNGATISTVSPAIMDKCLAGGTFTNCVFCRQAQASTGQYTFTLTSSTGFTFSGCTIRANTIRAHATTYSIVLNTVSDCVFENTTIVQGGVSLASCSNLTFTNTSYTDAVTGTTLTTNPHYVFYFGTSRSYNIIIDRITLPITDTHPYSGLVHLNAIGCFGIVLKNVGTYSTPLNLGTVNASAFIMLIGTNASCSNISMKRVYTVNTRSGIFSADNSNSIITMLNVFGDYADADISACHRMVQRGIGSTKSLTAQTAVYGTHWMDYFTSTTAGQIAILMNEPTVQTADQVSLTNGASFTSAGSLYMPTIGMTATFTMPSYIIGHTGFSNTALVLAGGLVGYYTYAYQIDKNDGNGYSAWSSEYTAANLGTALSGVTGINALLGLKLKIRITTSTTNTYAITSVYVTTTSTTTTQAYQYPLDDPRTLTLTGLQSNCDVVILQAGTSTELVNVDQNPTSSYAYSYYYTAGTYVDIGIFKTGYVPFYIRNYLLTDGNASIPVAQTPDRNFS